MKLVIALGIALGATAMAYAQSGPMRVMIRDAGMDLNLDANHDGWITRDEASAAADRMFDELDANHDGRLTAADHPAMGEHMHMMHGGPDGADLAPDANCTTTNSTQHSSDNGHRTERRVTIICNGDDAQAPHAQSGQSHTERDVTVIVRNDGDEAVAPPAPPQAPEPPAPPHAPMAMMLLASMEEADTNHDGALSREEFRAQQLRFFDAADVNGDHRIRAHEMPEAPPAPPEPPAPPAPPASH